MPLEDDSDTLRHAYVKWAKSEGFEDMPPLRVVANRREFEKHQSAAIEDALRASPDFAPAFAEPGEMERREREEAEETGSCPILAAIIIGLLAASPVLAILLVTWMRSGF